MLEYRIRFKTCLTSLLGSSEPIKIKISGISGKFVYRKCLLELAYVQKNQAIGLDPVLY